MNKHLKGSNTLRARAHQFIMRLSLLKRPSLRKDEDLVAADKRLGPEAADLLDPGTAVRRRTTPGGAGPGPVAVQRGRFSEQLAAQRTRL